VEADVFLKRANGTIYKGRVWPGTAVFPDWFHSNTQGYWNEEFANFFDKDTGIDIDALWIDMNEPSNFCEYPCANPDAATAQDVAGLHSRRASLGQSLGVSKVRGEEIVTHGPSTKHIKRQHQLAEEEIREVSKRQTGGSKKGLPGRDLINPSYKIQNAMGSLSNKTADTDLIHQGGWAEYDTHNL
jgi:alpha-glucosidase